jgi:hypothetical protein
MAQSTVDCACVIHGTAYDWQYVDRLYNMLTRNISAQVRLHVYTEANRPVPGHMIKHPLTDWGVHGPKKSWWYKLQMFDSQHHSGPMLYLDLDTVIVRNIDWIFQQDPRQFWCIKDFQHLYQPTCTDINSSVMYWNTTQHDYVWQEFQRRGVDRVIGQHRGDQDYLTEVLHHQTRRYLPRIHSWRWQCWDGGYDFRRRTWQQPGAGTNIEATDILVFHGRPKPAEVDDPVIRQHWQ